MNGRNYIPPSALNLMQNLPPRINQSPPPHFIIIEDNMTAIHHRQMKFLLTENQRLNELHVSASHELSVAQQDLRHVSAVAGKVKAEREEQLREMYDKAVKMEDEVKLIDESKTELDKMNQLLKKLRSEKKELDVKLKNVLCDVVKMSKKWKRFSVMKSEIETMKKEIERGREIIEHEKRVNASNIKQSQSMENYKILMAGEIHKLRVEVVDARKRARAAAAAEAASVPV
ncbi:hypothetical protein QVD17_17474 [Tagetes erecta]|uniref:Uncharacterized protein n=1 Tax=Tagetes erecta TaxID=13708 RepID=A0AAD8KZJ8_TARER|nr:hypothetical protein QVD17_17474 [Tagetes erecta]